MSTRPHTRFTIGQIMGLIAAFAALWAVLATPGSARFIVSVLLPMAAIIVGPIVILHHMVDGSFGIQCPGCGGLTMERPAVSSFGPRFYRCSTCGVRCKRGTLGAWQDASGAEYDVKYARKVEEDPWTAPPGLEDEDFIFSKTHMNLVRNKRRRRPENPNGPGLE